MKALVKFSKGLDEDVKSLGNFYDDLESHV